MLLDSIGQKNLFFSNRFAAIINSNLVDNILAKKSNINIY